MSVRCVAMCLGVMAAQTGFGQDAGAASPGPIPSADEIKRVLEYQDNGKDRGPALLDIVPCAKIDQTKGSPTQFHCLEPIAGPVKKGTQVHAWAQFFCPKDGKYEDVSFQWLHEGQVRTTIDLTVTGLSRTRTWRTTTLTKPGKWTIKVMRGDKELGSASVVVEP